MQRGLKKAFCVFHKLCSSLGEAVSPRAPFAPCLAPTYPDGRTWFLCCFSSTGIRLFVTQLFCTTEGTDILGEWSGKFHSFCCLEKEPVTLLFFAEPGTVFYSFCISAFPVFPHVPIYMHSKPAAPGVTVGWSSCFKKREFMRFLFPRLSKSQVTLYAEGKPSQWRLKYSVPNSWAAGAGGCFER